MVTEKILVLLSVALILQHSHASSVIGTGAKASNLFEELPVLTTIRPHLSSGQLAIDNLYYERMKTIFRSIDEFYFLTYDVIRGGRTLFQDVLADLRNSTMVERTADFNAKISKLTEFNDRVDNFKPCQDYYVKIHAEALKLYFDQLDALNATSMKNPSTVDLLLDASLRKNGLKTVEQEAVLRISKYLEKFSKQLNEFEESLHGRERTATDDVKAWLLELHDLKTLLVQFSTRVK